MGKERKIKLILQVAGLFALAILITGTITHMSERYLSDKSVVEQAENLADELAAETTWAIQEYPAYEWLVSYWTKNAESLDIEYDVDYSTGQATRTKSAMLESKYPQLVLKYATTSEIEAMEPADQKAYAEVAYSWLITRLNQIKRAYKVDFLFCVLTEDDCAGQFFLLSAADEGAHRGTSYEDVYTLGHTVTVMESQTDAMRNAIKNAKHLADAGKYVDYYSYVGSFEGKHLLIGITYNLSVLQENIDMQANYGTALAMAHQLLLSLVCLTLLALFVIRPFKKMQESIHLYMQSKDSAKVAENLSTIKSRNEIGQLSEDIVDLTAEIDDYLNHIEKISAEKERIATELSLATSIQAHMLPSIFPAFPERSEFEVFASMDPAKEVGGDFYDFFLIDDDHLCVVIADVSGKGIPAALFMMASKILLKNHAQIGKSPAQVLNDTNKAVCSNNRDNMFVTVWLGILEISTGKFVAANAGHDYPTLKDPDGNFELVKDKHGLFIGMMEEASYTEYEWQLKPGSKVFVYTDGVPEATNAQGERLGLDPMLEALNTDPEAKPEQILKNVRAGVDAFVKDAEQFDDITMLCLEYLGSA